MRPAYRIFHMMPRNPRLMQWIVTCAIFEKEMSSGVWVKIWTIKASTMETWTMGTWREDWSFSYWDKGKNGPLQIRTNFVSLLASLIHSPLIWTLKLLGFSSFLFLGKSSEAFCLLLSIHFPWWRHRSKTRRPLPGKSSRWSAETRGSSLCLHLVWCLTDRSMESQTTGMDRHPWTGWDVGGMGGTPL